MGDEKRLQELGVDVLETDEDNSDEEEKACEVAHKSEWEIWRDDQARRHAKRKTNVVDLLHTAVDALAKAECKKKKRKHSDSEVRRRVRDI